MSVTYFGVNTDTLRSDVSKIEESFNSMKSRIAEIYENVEALNALWDGPANDSFNQAFKQDHSNVNAYFTTLNNIIEQLDRSRENYDKCETEVENMVDSLHV